MTYQKGRFALRSAASIQGAALFQQKEEVAMS